MNGEKEPGSTALRNTTVASTTLMNAGRTNG